jgi:hypothetical protein
MSLVEGCAASLKVVETEEKGAKEQDTTKKKNR